MPSDSNWAPPSSTSFLPVDACKLPMPAGHPVPGVNIAFSSAHTPSGDPQDYTQSPATTSAPQTVTVASVTGHYVPEAQSTSGAYALYDASNSASQSYSLFDGGAASILDAGPISQFESQVLRALSAYQGAKDGPWQEAIEQGLKPSDTDQQAYSRYIDDSSSLEASAIIPKMIQNARFRLSHFLQTTLKIMRNRQSYYL